VGGRKTPQKPRIGNVDEAAKFLRINRYTLYRMLRRHEIPPGAFRIGRLWRFDLGELERFAKTNINRPK
jgi:excisionase family DNA binding protein